MNFYVLYARAHPTNICSMYANVGVAMYAYKCVHIYRLYIINVTGNIAFLNYYAYKKTRSQKELGRGEA